MAYRRCQWIYTGRPAERELTVTTNLFTNTNKTRVKKVHVVHNNIKHVMLYTSALCSSGVGCVLFTFLYFVRLYFCACWFPGEAIWSAACPNPSHANVGWVQTM